MNVGGKAFFALAPLVAISMGCSSEEGGGKNPALPLGAPSLRIERVGEVSNPTGTVEATIGCDGHIPVSVAVENWTLRPPGACFGYPQCGQIVVLIDPVEGLGAGADGGTGEAALSHSSATTFMRIDFSALSSPEGEHVIRAALVRDGTRTIALGSHAEPLEREIVVDAKAAADCDAGGLEDAFDAAEAEDSGLEDAQAEDAGLEDGGPEDAEVEDAAPEEEDASVVNDASTD